MPRRAALALAIAGLAALPATPAVAARDASVPVGIENVNDAALDRAAYRYVLRFVLDETTRVDRMFNGWKLVGARCNAPGSRSYARGDGGRIEAKLVGVKRNGRPDTAALKHTDVFTACRRYRATKAEYGIEREPVLLYVRTGGAKLRADTMYALVFRNASRFPRRRYASINSPVTDFKTAGPQGRNELDAHARGAIMGLDPRESVAWSRDGGRRYVWGRAVGSYRGRGFGAVKIPFYGWQTAPGGLIGSNQPYYAYHGRGTDLTTTYHDAQRPLTLVRAGGFTAGADLGTVTVTNLETGATSSTRALSGRGLRSGSLSAPVEVRIGDDYAVHASGEVAVLEADEPQRALFPFLGRPLGPFPYTSDGGNTPEDVAQLFAQPRLSSARPSRTARITRSWSWPDKSG